MVELCDGEVLAALRGYLEELGESGVDELEYADEPAEAVGVQAPGREPACAVILKGVGNPRARLAFLRSGTDLAAPSEELLTKIIAAMGFPVQDVYMLNFEPQAGEDGAGVREALLARLSSVGPEVVVALGEGAAQLLLQSPEPIASLRGRFRDLAGMQLMATLHPDQLVADPALKRQVWHEMQQVMARLGKR